MAEDTWHPEAVGSVSAGDGEFVINLFKNGQVQKSLYYTDTSLSSACVPLPPPCTTSAWLSPNSSCPPTSPAAGSVQRGLPRFHFGARIFIFGEQRPQGTQMSRK